MLLICNYSGGTMGDAEIYQVGKPATNCKYGPNPKHPGLCNAPIKKKKVWPMPFNNPDKEHYCEMGKRLCGEGSIHVGCETDGVWFS